MFIYRFTRNLLISLVVKKCENWQQAFGKNRNESTVAVFFWTRCNDNQKQSAKAFMQVGLICWMWFKGN